MDKHFWVILNEEKPRDKISMNEIFRILSMVNYKKSAGREIENIAKLLLQNGEYVDARKVIGELKSWNFPMFVKLAFEFSHLDYFNEAFEYAKNLNSLTERTSAISHMVGYSNISNAYSIKFLYSVFSIFTDKMNMHIHPAISDILTRLGLLLVEIHAKNGEFDDAIKLIHESSQNCYIFDDNLFLGPAYVCLGIFQYKAGLKVEGKNNIDYGTKYFNSEVYTGTKDKIAMHIARYYSENNFADDAARTAETIYGTVLREMTIREVINALVKQNYDIEVLMGYFGVDRHTKSIILQKIVRIYADNSRFEEALNVVCDNWLIFDEDIPAVQNSSLHKLLEYISQNQLDAGMVEDSLITIKKSEIGYNSVMFKKILLKMAEVGFFKNMNLAMIMAQITNLASNGGAAYEIIRSPYLAGRESVTHKWYRYDDEIISYDSLYLFIDLSIKIENMDLYRELEKHIDKLDMEDFEYREIMVGAYTKFAKSSLTKGDEKLSKEFFAKAIDFAKLWPDSLIDIASTQYHLNCKKDAIDTISLAFDSSKRFARQSMDIEKLIDALILLRLFESAEYLIHNSDLFHTEKDSKYIHILSEQYDMHINIS